MVMVIMSLMVDNEGFGCGNCGNGCLWLVVKIGIVILR